MTLAPATVEEFRRDGACVLRGVLADWVEALRAGVERNIAEPSPVARIYDGADGTGRFFGDFCSWDRIPEYRAFVFESPAAGLAAELMGSERVRLFHEHVLVKEPGTDIPTPWHQDGPYYCTDGEQTVSLWIPLDDVPRDTTLEFVAGSHRWGRTFRPERFDRTPLVPADDRESAPDVDADRDAFSILGWALAPGDAVAFTYRTLHGAPANRRTTRRRAFSLRLLGDDCRYVRRPATSPPFPGLRLADGDEMDAPEFPVLHPRPPRISP